MEAETYEHFIRQAFNSGRNSKIGADTDIFRSLESAYGAYQQKTIDESKLTEPGTPIPQQLVKYNREAIEVARFVGDALNQYVETHPLNETQKASLKELQAELANKPVFETIVSTIEQAKQILDDKPEFSFSASGFLDNATYTFGLRPAVEKHLNFFEGLEKLELILSETPYSMLGNPRPTPMTVSDKGKKLKIEYSANKSYNTKGQVTSVPTQFDIYQSLEYVLSNAIIFYRDHKKAQKESAIKSTDGETTGSDS